jgi:hypothetical protein
VNCNCLDVLLTDKIRNETPTGCRLVW